MTTDDAWISAERKHERDMTDMRMRDDRDKREELTTRIGYISAATAAILIVTVLATLIYLWQKSNGERGQELEQACIAANGTWTTIGGGTSSTCVHLDQTQVPR